MKKNRLFTICACLSLSVITVKTNAQDTWVNVASQGVDKGSNEGFHSMEVFNGNIYATAGTYQGHVYRSATGNPNSWTRVFSDPYSYSVDAIAKTALGGGNLYIASSGGCCDTSRVYRSTDGLSWTPYLISNAEFIVPFQGLGTTDSIYVIEYNGSGDIIRKSSYNSNDPYNTGGTWDTVLNFGTLSLGTHIRSAAVHNGKFYIGNNDGTLWSSADGHTWTQNANVGNGFGVTNNTALSAIRSFGGSVYVGTSNGIDGPQLWKSADDTTWTLAQQFASDHDNLSSLNVADSKLWITLSSGEIPQEIVRTDDGSTFVVSNNNGFGVSGNSGVYASVIQFGNNVYWSGENYNEGGGKLRSTTDQGGQIWRTCTVTPPVIDLGSDQTSCSGVAHIFDAGPGVSYIWSNGDTTQTISVSSQGNYSVEVVGTNGCTGSDLVALFNIPAPGIIPPNVPPAVCSGTPIPLNPIAISNSYVADPPIHKATNDLIGDVIGPEVYDTINVSGLSTICSCDALLSVTIDSLDHTYSSDMELTIQAPDGSNIILSNGNGNSDNNTYYGTEFNMFASQSIGSAPTPYTGAYIPEGDFHALTGSPNGAWVLHVEDVVSGDDGVLKGWSIRFKVDDTVMTYSWSPATGLSSVNTLNTVATPTSAITYTLTTTNSLGCSTQTPLAVNVPSIGLPQAADTVCYLSSVAINLTGGSANTTWAPATGLSGTTGQSITAAPTSSTMYYLTDTISGCPLYDSIYLYTNSLVTITSPAPQTICHNDTAALTASAAGGSAPYTFKWDLGGVYYYGSTIYQSPASGTSYTIVATDAAGCSAGGSTSLSVLPSTDIYGHVSYSGGSVNASNVVLYRYFPFLTYFDTVQTTTTDGSGDYHFASVDHSSYLIKVFPAATYTTLVPSYYGHVFLWDSATIVSHACSVNDTFNIVTVEETGTTGPGYLQGTIHEDYGFGVRIPGDPIPGVDVKLGRNPGGALVTCTQTDTAGTYSFSNVAYGNYTVYADIPGLGRDSSYTFTVDSVNVSYLNLDYLVDSTLIFIDNNVTTGITPSGITAIKQNVFSVYPNPSKGAATIEYSLAEDSKVSLGIYNVLGVKVIDLENTKQLSGDYKYSINAEKDDHLSNGVYFVTLIINGKTNIRRLVINE